jgi:hypothetical protein
MSAPGQSSGVAGRQGSPLGIARRRAPRLAAADRRAVLEQTRDAERGFCHVALHMAALRDAMDGRAPVGEALLVGDALPETPDVCEDRPWGIAIAGREVRLEFPRFAARMPGQDGRGGRDGRAGGGDRSAGRRVRTDILLYAAIADRLGDAFRERGFAVRVPVLRSDACGGLDGRDGPATGCVRVVLPGPVSQGTDREALTACVLATPTSPRALGCYRRLAALAERAGRWNLSPRPGGARDEDEFAPPGSLISPDALQISIASTRVEPGHEDDVDDVDDVDDDRPV